MKLPSFEDSPFQLRLTFSELIEKHRETLQGDDPEKAAVSRKLLEDIAPYPELWEGIQHVEQLEQHEELIRRILSKVFPSALTLNEIKAASIPYLNILFNHTQRFKNILNAAGPGFDINIRDFDEHQFYVFSCCIILNSFYGTHLDFTRPLFYDIPTASGIMRHYRILYNADFMHILPTEKSIELSVEDIDQLLNNYDDVALWKRKFPPGSYILQGFALMSLVDITVDNAVSTLKGKLLNPAKVPNLKDDFEQIFRSIFGIADLKLGFASYDAADNCFSLATYVNRVKSFVVGDAESCDGREIFLPSSFSKLVEREQYIAVSDTAQFLVEHPESKLAKRFLEQGIHSFILAPLVKEDNLLGIVEVVSGRSRELNSVNAHKLEVVLPFITDTIDRRITDYRNQIQAVIQNEYTTLHPSVQWRFRDEAVRYIKSTQLGIDYVLKDVVFNDVYPLYGQIDIKGSSDARNQATRKDLVNELTALRDLLLSLEQQGLQLAGETDTISEYCKRVSGSALLKTDKEQQIQSFIETEVHQLLRMASKEYPVMAEAITDYFDELNRATGSFFHHRRLYDSSVSLINQKMAAILDIRQADAQEIFPHYFERFKTDGVEHNMYVGASIAPEKKFRDEHFKDLRLWEMQVLCEMEQKHQLIKPSLPYPLDVTTLILAFSVPLSIRFRMDEKRFDVDGTYNVRFEMLKKRIDKARIKGSKERVVSVGKLTIVYANESDEQEYEQYLRLLAENKIVGTDVEYLELEDLPGVSGLKALRCSIIHIHNPVAPVL